MFIENLTLHIFAMVSVACFIINRIKQLQQHKNLPFVNQCICSLLGNGKFFTLSIKQPSFCIRQRIKPRSFFEIFQCVIDLFQNQSKKNSLTEKNVLFVKFQSFLSILYSGLAQFRHFKVSSTAKVDNNDCLYLREFFLSLNFFSRIIL